MKTKGMTKSTFLRRYKNLFTEVKAAYEEELNNNSGQKYLKLCNEINEMCVEAKKYGIVSEITEEISSKYEISRTMTWLMCGVHQYFGNGEKERKLFCKNFRKCRSKFFEVASLLKRKDKNKSTGRFVNINMDSKRGKVFLILTAPDEVIDINDITTRQLCEISKRK